MHEPTSVRKAGAACFVSSNTVVFTTFCSFPEPITLVAAVVVVVVVVVVVGGSIVLQLPSSTVARALYSKKDECMQPAITAV